MERAFDNCNDLDLLKLRVGKQFASHCSVLAGMLMVPMLIITRQNLHNFESASMQSVFGVLSVTANKYTTSAAGYTASALYFKAVQQIIIR